MTEKAKLEKIDGPFRPSYKFIENDLDTTVKPKKRRASKQKGNKFELKISRMLTEWITGNKKPDLYWRSPGSGSVATLDTQKCIVSDICGDIIPVQPEGLFFTNLFLIEVKDRKSIKIDMVHLLKGKSTIFRYWDKAAQEAENHGREPLFIFKGSNTPNFIMFNKVTYRKIVQFFGAIHNYLCHEDLYMCLFDDFLKHIDPKILKDISSQWV